MIATNAEKAVLGCIMLEPVALLDVMQALEPGDFQLKHNRTIYEIALALNARHKVVDFATITDALEQKKLLDECGGYDYITQLSVNVPSALRALEYAGEVKRASRVRKIEAACDEVKTAIDGGETDPDELATMLDVRMSKARDAEKDGSHWTSADIYAQAEAIINGAGMGRSTGFPRLDSQIGGIKPGALILVAGRPSMGKTAYALDVAVTVWNHGGVVAFFSKEMSKEQVLARALSMSTGVSLQRIQGHEGSLTDDENAKICAAAADMEERWSGFNLYGDTDIDVSYMRSSLAKLTRKNKVDLVVLDYVQLMKINGYRGNRNGELSDISRDLKLLAQELGTCVLVLSQLTRDNERERRLPVLSDLRDSGALEQDADVVLFLHRANKEQSGTMGTIPKPDDEADLILAKNRNGPTGAIKLHWDGSHTLFTERDTTNRTPPPAPRQRGD